MLVIRIKGRVMVVRRPHPQQGNSKAGQSVHEVDKYAQQARGFPTLPPPSLSRTYTSKQ